MRQSNILTAEEFERFDNPPNFSSSDRKSVFWQSQPLLFLIKGF